MEEKEAFQIDGNTHEVGNQKCGECWNDPAPCICGGLIHSQFLDENYDSVIVGHKCDKCGSTSEPDDYC